jgi:hypothetical protein
MLLRFCFVNLVMYNTIVKTKFKIDCKYSKLI